MWIKCWGVWYDIYIKYWWINYGKIKKKVLFVNKIEKKVLMFFIDIDEWRVKLLCMIVGN